MHGRMPITVLNSCAVFITTSNSNLFTMFQENVSRLGGKYSKCTDDDEVWQDLRNGRVVTIDNERYNRKVRNYNFHL